MRPLARESSSTSIRAGRNASPDASPAVPLPPPAWVPPAVPGYTLAEELGHGGMGVVYRATDATLQRTVAVKVLRDADPAGRSARERFVAEARITGRLQHPGIPVVYQVGTAADGRPFLAMKLVAGRTLERIIDAKAPLDVVAVFEQIARAVGYAHAQGVIHRDLKPANVMVGPFGEVQVMDWGLAKQLGSDLPATEVLRRGAVPERKPPADRDATQDGTILGTLAYMAPEQAAGQLADIDARSDVFGLGGILCAMLTGEPPYEGDSSSVVGVNAVLGRTHAARARLAGCDADPALVALCLRCLSADKAARPADGTAVADEVAAQRRRAAERARDADLARDRAEGERKRRRTRAAAAGLVAAVLIVGLAGTGVGYVRAERARAEAEAAGVAAAKAHRDETLARTAAETANAVSAERAADATALKEFIRTHIFAAARPEVAGGGRGKDVSLRDAIRASLPEISKQFARQPRVEADLRDTLGATFLMLGDPVAAVAEYERALELVAALEPPGGEAVAARRAVLAGAYAEAGRHSDALGLRERVAADHAALFPPTHPALLTSRGHLASSYADLGRLDDALKLRDDLHAEWKRKLGPTAPATIAALHNVADSYRKMDRPHDAVARYEECLALAQRHLGPDHLSTLRTMQSLGGSYADTDRVCEGLQLNAAALELMAAKLGPAHPMSLRTANNYAACLRKLGAVEDALERFEAVRATAEAKFGADHDIAIAALDHAAFCEQSLERYESAAAKFERVVRVRSAAVGADHPATLRTLANLAECYARADRWESLLGVRLRWLAAARSRFGHDSPEALDVAAYAVNDLTYLRRGAEAQPLVEECLARRGKLTAHALWMVYHGRLRHYERQGEIDECRATVAAWEGLNRNVLPGDIHTTACWHAVIAKLLAAAGDPTAAVEADLAMDHLALAVCAGFRRFDHMRYDPDLRDLRSRADFHKLIGEADDD